jgi:hypothetical protein
MFEFDSSKWLDLCKSPKLNIIQHDQTLTVEMWRLDLVQPWMDFWQSTSE